MNSGMFKTSVKTSTPAQGMMQILCLTVFWLFISAMTSAAHAKSASPAETMAEQVKQWLSQTHSVNSKEVTIAPLDERLKVQACAKPLTVDHPFQSKETVRVRCSEPTWQLYLQVKLPNSGFVAANSSNGTTNNSNVSTNNSNGATVQNPSVVPKTVVVARRLIQRGSILQPDMLEVVQASPGNADTQLLSSLKDAQNAELTRDIAAGQALRISDIRRAVMVKQGQSVMFSVGNGKEFQISIRMEAMQDGRLGEQVKLKNPESGRQVSGVVSGLNSAKGL
jgi:flagella basal body P-ring formation protein FlgA